MLFCCFKESSLWKRRIQGPFDWSARHYEPFLRESSTLSVLPSLSCTQTVPIADELPLPLHLHVCIHHRGDPVRVPLPVPVPSPSHSPSLALTPAPTPAPAHRIRISPRHRHHFAFVECHGWLEGSWPGYRVTTKCVCVLYSFALTTPHSPLPTAGPSLQSPPARYSFLFVLLYILFLLLCILRFCPSEGLFSSLLYSTSSPLCLCAQFASSVPVPNLAAVPVHARSLSIPIRAPMALIMMLLVMMDRLVVRNRPEALAIRTDNRSSRFSGSGCQVYTLLTIIRSHLVQTRSMESSRKWRTGHAALLHYSNRMIGYLH